MEHIVEVIFEDVRNQNAGAAVNSCLRAARLQNDAFNIAFFLFEQEHGEKEVLRHLIRDLPNLDNEQLSSVHKFALERNIKNKTVLKQEAEILGDAKHNILRIGAGMLDDEIEACSDQIAALSIPSGMDPYDTAAFYKENELLKLRIITRKAAVRRLKQRTLSICFNYASQLEKQLKAQKSRESSLIIIEQEVSAFLREYCVDAFHQFVAASESLTSSEQEELAAGLLQVRRCLKSVADFVQPATEDQPGLSVDKFLNRLSFFVENARKHEAAVQLAFDHTMTETLLRRLNERASKGVHSALSRFEAHQVHIGMTLYLHQITHLYQSTSSKF